MTDEQRSQLIKLAGEMLRGQGMPLPEVEDWGLPTGTSRKTRRKIQEAATAASEQARRWAVAIYDIVDRDRVETKGGGA